MIGQLMFPWHQINIVIEFRPNAPLFNGINTIDIHDDRVPGFVDDQYHVSAGVGPSPSADRNNKGRAISREPIT
jgi:hypothetical protein